MNIFLFIVAGSEMLRLRAEECGMHTALEVTLCLAQGQLHACDLICAELLGTCSNEECFEDGETAALGVTVLAQHWEEVRRLRFVMPEMRIV